jgi:hypothetical protein
MELLLTEAKQNGAPESKQNVASSDRQSRMELPFTEPKALSDAVFQDVSAGI